MADMKKNTYLVTPIGDKQRTVSQDTAVVRSGKGSGNPRDEMNGNSVESERPYLRMSAGNILEAKGRDVSISSGDVDPNGWGGEDAPYAGMATDAPYGSGAGMGKKK